MGLERKEITQLTREISRHGLAYVICSIGELFRQYRFHPIDLLIVYAVLNISTLDAPDDLEPGRQSYGPRALGTDAAKHSLSRAALRNLLNLPANTVRHHISSLKRFGVLEETEDGLIVSKDCPFEFDGNPELHEVNVVLIRRLMKDLARLGIDGSDDL